jgi:hypothetical protein
MTECAVAEGTRPIVITGDCEPLYVGSRESVYDASGYVMCPAEKGRFKFYIFIHLNVERYGLHS